MSNLTFKERAQFIEQAKALSKQAIELRLQLAVLPVWLRFPARAALSFVERLASYIENKARNNAG